MTRKQQVTLAWLMGLALTAMILHTLLHRPWKLLPWLDRPTVPVLEVLDDDLPPGMIELPADL
jgi:hypothetical protein